MSDLYQVPAVGRTIPRYEISFVIPTIAPRHSMLCRAVDSIREQTVRPGTVHVVEDTNHDGAARTRQRGLEAVNTPWVMFLDDDDALMPQHVQRCIEHQSATGADYVFPWFMIKDVVGGEHPEWDPFPMEFGTPWSNDKPRQTTITTLVRTELAKAVGFTSPPPDRFVDGQIWGEDYTFTLGIMANGGVISHLPERTWWWYHHGKNTSGQPTRW